MKRVLSFLLVAVMLCGIVPTASAANDEATKAADTLYALGLFNGTGTDASGKPMYDLDRAPTRHEAVTMLVRLLGKGEEALAGNWKMPFTDVAAWAKPYVGYAYANGLTSGTSATTYSGNEIVTASQYLTFILRALGYDSGVDFQWDKAWELSDAIGLTSGEYCAETDAFLRSDIALISESALSAKLKGSNVMLLRKLYNQKSAANWASTAKTKQVSSLGLPKAIGKTTLTYDEAYALLGKDPAAIAEAVKTVGDVVQYMIAVNFGENARATHTPWFGDAEWGFDPPGEEQVRQNYGTCCAGFANVGLYLLKGDYEEQGIIRWLGGGNHTINYVRTGGKYYVFDLTNYYGGNYQGPITVLDRLEDYYDQMPTDDYPKAEVVNLVALVDTDVCYPWDHVKETALIFPTETKGHILQIYQKDASAGISFRDVHIEVPFWNSDRVELLEQVTDDTEHDVYETLKEEYMSADITLLFSNGFLVQEESKFGTGRGDWQITVQADGRAIANYTAKSSDPSICNVHVEGNGILTFMPKQSGSCTLYITYQGQTAEFYYQTAF